MNLDPTLDLKVLTKEEIFKFAKFADERLKAYKKNFYHVGFVNYLKIVFSA